MTAFRPAAEKLFFSLQDPQDPRLGQLTRSHCDLIEPGTWVLAGYPDDEGIRLNGGRPGAAGAPEAIRHWLYRMTPSLHGQADAGLIDRGDLNLGELDLPARHQAVRSEAARTLNGGARWIGLGGGHDYGFPDTAGFMDAVEGSARPPLVINLDAHLDVRPADKGFHSGTPFRRFVEEFPGVELIEIGIQSQCNAKAHSQWLRQQGCKIWTLDELSLNDQSAGAAICARLLPSLERPRPVFLSIDLDVFSSAYAPGCSQSWPTGLQPADALMVIDFLAFRADIRAAGLYEVSPPLDIDGRTARLAALLAHRLIFQPAREGGGN
jgi:formiminoglutamase